MTTAIEPIVKACPVCETEFVPRTRRHTYCCRKCKDTGQRESRPVVVRSDLAPVRKEPMTSAELAGYLAANRAELDSKPQIEGDRYYQCSTMRLQRRDGWQIQQIARWHGVPASDVRERLGETV